MNARFDTHLEENDPEDDEYDGFSFEKTVESFNSTAMFHHYPIPFYSPTMRSVEKEPNLTQFLTPTYTIDVRMARFFTNHLLTTI